MGKQFDLETQSWTDVIDIHEPDEVLPDIDAHGYLIGKILFGSTVELLIIPFLFIIFSYLYMHTFSQS